MSTSATPTPTEPTAVADPAAPAPNSSLYVGDLNPEVTESDVFEIFSAVGTVSSIRICRDTVTRRSLGYGYVNFNNHEDAARALDILNYENIKDTPCRIMWSQRDPSLRKSGVGNIFVKNLDESIDNQQLYDTFSQFGNILSCKVSIGFDGKSRGYGFVHYDSDESANRAISEANGMLLPDKPVHVAKFLRRSERRSTTAWTNLFVKNIPLDWDESRLTKEFEAYGGITSLMIKKNEEGASVGFGFVNMDSHENAVKAVEGLNGMKVGEIEVTDKKPAEDGSEETVEVAKSIDKLLFVGQHKSKKEYLRETASARADNSRKAAEKFAGRNVYVRNLDDSVDEKVLLEQFSAWGTITSAIVMKDKEGNSRGFGFVCFDTPEEATAAISNMNNKMIDRKPIYVALAQRKEVRRSQLEQMRREQAMARMRMGGGGMMGGFPGMPGYPNPMAGNRMPMPGMYAQPMMNRGMGGMGGYPNNGGNFRGGRGGGARRGGRGGYGGHMAPPMAAHAPAPPMPAPAAAGSGLDAQALAAASPEERQNMIGERLYPLVAAMYPDEAAKITGMLLEMEVSDLLHLLESPEALSQKVKEAIEVLRAHTA